jgi:ketosteroid isomerase-like protein
MVAQVARAEVGRTACRRRLTVRPASEENVEIAQAAYDAWNTGDLESVLDRLHPHVEREENAQVCPGLDPIYHGHEGFLKRQRDAFDAWEWFTVKDREFIDAGEHVVVPLDLTAKGRHSGIEVEMTVCSPHLPRWKGRTPPSVCSRADALEAVGLEE